MTRTAGPPGALEQTFKDAVRYHEAGQLDAAESLYLRVLSQRRAHFGALHLMGVCRHQRGDFAGAMKHLRAALKLKPDAALAHLSLGNAQREARALEEAVQSYRRATMIDPGLAIAQYNLGTALEEAGRHQEALAAYDAALALQADAAARAGRANCLQVLGRVDEAIGDYLAAVDLDPAQADALANLAGALLRRERFDEALAATERALALQPAHAGAALNRAMALNELQRGDEALQAADHVLAVAPPTAEALYQRGRALAGLRRGAEAVAPLQAALHLEPGHRRARMDLAAALAMSGEPEAATGVCDELLRERPADAYARFNRGMAAYSAGHLGSAREDMEAALAIDPLLPTARMSLGQLHLLEGRFDEGWPLYEGRWDQREMRAIWREFPQALWLGAHDISESTVLVHAEQGMGDIVQFARYVPLLAQRARRVVFEVRGALFGLIRRSLPSHIDVLPRGAPLPSFDCHCPLLSLPMVFATRLETIPWPGAYLAPDPARVALWRERLGEPTGLRVGLAWSGSAVHGQDRTRSIALAQLGGLVGRAAAGGAGVQFIGLQNELRAGDRPALAAMPALQYFGEAIDDFDDTAALASLCNVVVSVDSAPAHVAGALGKPLCLLLPFVPDWRWLLGRSDSPWYPSARLFRQERRGQWEGVLERVAAELVGVAADPDATRGKQARIQSEMEAMPR